MCHKAKIQKQMCLTFNISESISDVEEDGMIGAIDGCPVYCFLLNVTPVDILQHTT